MSEVESYKTTLKELRSKLGKLREAGSCIASLEQRLEEHYQTGMLPFCWRKLTANVAPSSGPPPPQPPPTVEERSTQLSVTSGDG